MACATHTTGMFPRPPMAGSALPETRSSGDERVRVGHLIWTLRRGGAETLLAQGLKYGDEARFDYSVASLMTDDRELEPEFVRAGVDVVMLGFPNPLTTVWSMARWLRGLDVLHSHAPLPAALARVLTLVFGPRNRIYTEHGSFLAYRKGAQLAHRLTVPLERRIVAVSNAVKQAIPGRHSDRATVVVHGIDPQLFAQQIDRAAVRSELGVTSDQILCLTVANFKDEKDLPTLISAIAQVHSQDKSVRFVHVGGGKMEGEVHDLAATHDVESAIQFLGIRRDVPTLMLASDALVLSSKSEGLPVTVMEAQTAGIPYVGTAVGGIPEVVESGKNGLLVDPGRPADLAQAILRFAREEDLRKTLGEGARSAAELFEAARAQGVLEDMYEELIA